MPHWAQSPPRRHSRQQQAMPTAQAATNKQVSEVHAVRLGHGEELATRQWAVTHDRRDHQRGEHDHEENSDHPVRHSQMLVTRRLPVV